MPGVVAPLASEPPRHGLRYAFAMSMVLCRDSLTGRGRAGALLVDGRGKPHLDRPESRTGFNACREGRFRPKSTAAKDFVPPRVRLGE
jgi:hypothetical protein